MKHKKHCLRVHEEDEECSRPLTRKEFKSLLDLHNVFYTGQLEFENLLSALKMLGTLANEHVRWDGGEGGYVCVLCERMAATEAKIQHDSGCLVKEALRYR
jgi:hypothetical protein